MLAGAPPVELTRLMAPSLIGRVPYLKYVQPDDEYREDSK